MKSISRVTDPFMHNLEISYDDEKSAVNLKNYSR